MESFKPGDSVFIIPKFAHLYVDDSGVILNTRTNPFRPMFNEYTVEFADHSTAKLLEFQIIENVPQCETVVAAVTFDSEYRNTAAETRGQASGRQIILQTPAFHIDMRVRRMKSEASIVGQILERGTKNLLTNLEVRLMREAMPIRNVISDSLGVFEFPNAPRGPLNLLVRIPQLSSRIIGGFSI
jgi:hypothetical protein